MKLYNIVMMKPYADKGTFSLLRLTLLVFLKVEYFGSKNFLNIIKKKFDQYYIGRRQVSSRDIHYTNDWKTKFLLICENL